MKETEFIRQNKDKWARFEQMNRSGQGNPDEISKLFVEITEDLSYSRTFYKKRSVRVYLNYMAQQVFTSLYKLKKDPFQRFLKFWTRSLPLELYRARKNILIAFVLFSLCLTIGVISTADDIDFARVMLSDGYVEMTNDFIEEGDPMKVYKQMDPLPMFFMIFFNNIRVAFFSFILGIFFSVGTAFFLVYNGIMVGAFQSYFYYKGLTVSASAGKALLLTTFLTIWIHGAFEISSIVIAGAAGLTLGNGLLFPGSYSRMQSLQITAKRGLKIMVGLTPFIFVAAIFESWITRLTDMPIAFKWAIILLSFGIMLLYFVIYPWIVARKYPEDLQLNEEPLFAPTRKFDLFRILHINEMFSEAFSGFRTVHKQFARPFWLLIFPMHIAWVSYLYVEFPYEFSFEHWWYENLGRIFNMGWINSFGYLLVSTALLSLSTANAIFAFYNGIEQNRSFSWKLWYTTIPKLFVRVFPLLLLISSALAFLPGMMHLLTIFVAHVVVVMIYGSGIPEGNYFSGLKRSFSLAFNNWGSGMVLFLLVGLIICVFFLVLTGMAGISSIFSEMVKWHTITLFDGYYFIQNGIRSFLFLLFVHYTWPIVLYSFAFLFYSGREKEEANGLFKRLERFGTGSKTYETEADHEE